MNHHRFSLSQLYDSYLNYIGGISQEWLDNYEVAKKYYKTNGNLLVKRNCKIVSVRGVKLGQWIHQQRSLFNKNVGVLSSEQIRMLNEIGMVWDTYEKNWQHMYKLAREYYFLNKDLRIPAKYKTSDGDCLGSWISTQRQTYRKDKAGYNKEHFRLLEEIGMVWDPFESQWELMYKAAVCYRKKAGHLLVPPTYETEKGEKLGAWINSQRGLYKKEALSTKQIELLDEIDMVWEPYEAQWDEMYSAARDYYIENGDLLVPLRYVTSEGKALGNWIGTQRQVYAGKGHGMMTDKKKELLDSIGMVWNPLDQKWLTNYQFACQYYEEKGNLLIPSEYEASDGSKLGKWIRHQREAFRKGKLSEERKERLDKIDMVW